MAELIDRAIIAALYNPTPAMLAAADAITPAGFHWTPKHGHPGGALVIWRAMISELLVEGERLPRDQRICVVDSPSSRSFPDLPPPGTLGTIISGGSAFRAPADTQRWYRATFDGHDINDMGGPHTFQVSASMIAPVGRTTRYQVDPATIVDRVNLIV